MATDQGAERGRPGPERVARYRWAAQIIAGGRVLDAGCGGGWGTARLADIAAAAVGVDFSPAVLADARLAFGDVASFQEGNLRSLPFGDEEFDSVVCFEAITHVAEPAQAVDELRRVLKPGGLLLISAPNRDVYPSGNPLHLGELTPADLQSLLAERFSHVAMYYQQAYFASLLCNNVMLALNDVEAPIDANIAKTIGGPPDSTLYTVAAATDGELPAEPAWLIIGKDVDHQEQQRRLDEWRQRAVEAEAEALALRKELRALQA